MLQKSISGFAIHIPIIRDPEVAESSIFLKGQNIRKHVWHTVSPVKIDNVNATVGTLLFFDFQCMEFRWLPSVKDILNFLLEATKNILSV